MAFVAVRYRVPRRHWLSAHLGCMVLSYYLLIGGAMNEAFLRVTVLRVAVPNLNSPVVGVTHRIVMLGFIGLWR